MRNQQTDWVGEWFPLLEELGEFCQIRFGRVRLDADGHAPPEWLYLPHARFDGIGGFAHLLRERHGQNPALPELSGQALLGTEHWWPKLKAFLRQLGEVQRQVHDRLARHAHWGAWYVLNLGRWLGIAGMRLLLRLERKLGNARNTKNAVFSNLGAWQPEPALRGAEPLPDAWLFAPPLEQSRPVAAGALTWDGKLALTLQVHPVLTLDAEAARAWVEDWKSRLLSVR